MFQDVEKELEAQIGMRQEMELAMKMLEKDVCEKQDALVALRQQLDDLRALKHELSFKLQVGNKEMQGIADESESCCAFIPLACWKGAGCGRVTGCAVHSSPAVRTLERAGGEKQMPFLLNKSSSWSRNVCVRQGKASGVVLWCEKSCGSLCSSTVWCGGPLV